MKPTAKPLKNIADKTAKQKPVNSTQKTLHIKTFMDKLYAKYGKAFSKLAKE